MFTFNRFTVWRAVQPNISEQHFTSSKLYCRVFEPIKPVLRRIKVYTKLQPMVLCELFLVIMFVTFPSAVSIMR